MASSIIPTSTWSHNCGMHVIADFLSEKLQQNNYKTIFTGQAYDELLEVFQRYYQQENLTWEKIRASSLRVSSTNLQIVWGMALRVMLQNVIKNNLAYKETLAEQYLALLNLLIDKKYTEASENYPILLAANKDYLLVIASEAKGFRITADSLEAQKLQEQFNECGFNRYCETIMAIDDGSEELYHWLSISELTVLCDYFVINPVINAHYEPSKIKKGPNLYFVNSDGLHWERMGDSNFNIPPKTCDRVFYQEFIKPGNSHFIKNLDKIGQVFFSQKYLDLHISQVTPLLEEMKKAFSQACSQGEHNAFSVLIAKYNKHISITDENKNNLLHHLVLEYNNRNIQFLIKELVCAKIDLHAVNHKGYTALHYAALKNNIFAITELHRQGASIDCVTPEGLSACHISAIYKNKQAFNALKALGASLSLEAYPNAINCLPFSWELDASLTPLKIAEKTLVASASKNQKEHNITIIEVTSKKEHKFALSLVIKTLYDFYLKNKNDRQLCLQVQNDFFLKSEIELSLLDDASLKIINLFYEESFADWINRLVCFLDDKDNNEIACQNIEKIIDIFSKHACQAIFDNKPNKIIDCCIADYRCLFINGKNSVLHYAFKHNKYDFLKEVIYDFFKSHYKGEMPQNKLKEMLDQTFELVSNKILDEYDRSLAFRLNRKKQYEKLKQNIVNAKTTAEQLKYRAKLSQHYIGDFNIYCVDKHHEKNKHSAKIQTKKISKWGYPFMLALRATGQIANGGVIRFGLEMARPLLPNMVQLPFTFVGGKVGAYFGEKIGHDPIIAEQYTKLTISNAISFALMPQYYVVSTILGGAVYYAFKDSGYDNIEALCQLTIEGVALGATNHDSDKVQSKQGEAYQYQLNKNLTPIVGEYGAKYVAPVVTFTDNTTQQVDQFLSGHLNQYLSHSAISSMGNAMKETFSTPVEMLQNLQQYSNSWIESGFNLIEGNVLHYLMNDSKFKAERLHAIQLYNTHQLQRAHLQLTEQANKENATLSKITSDLEEAQLVLTELSNSPDIPASVIHKQNLIISNLKAVLNRQQSYVKNIESNITIQNAAVNKALDLTQESYQKTEGFAYQEKWKDAYFAYKHSLFKPNRSDAESEKLLKEAEKALIDCQFYNTEAVNKMLDPWAKSVDDLFDRHKENFPDWQSPHHVINGIIDSGFKNYSDRNQLAKFLADEIIRLKYPLYPETGDKQEIEAERELLIKEICTDELSGYQRKTNRSKNRLYDYFIAKVTNTEKKRHQHRWEKACKPVANEILQKLVGWRPFKDFNGGEDGEPGRVGVQFTFHSDGTKNVQATLNDRPIAMLYESEKPALQLTAPERQSIMLALPSNQAEASRGYNPAALTYDNTEEIEITSGSSLNADNPYFEDYFAEQHADLCNNIDKLGKKEEDKEPTKKPAKPRGVEFTAESVATPKPVVFSESAQAVSQSNQKGWSQIHDKWIGNPRSAATLLGPRAPVQISPDLLAGLTPQIKEDRIPVGRLPGLVWTALGEAGQDFVQGIISLNEFTYREFGHLKNGEDLESVQIVMLLGKFIGEEAARLALKEELKSAKIAKQMILDFRTLPQEERLKAVIKFYASVVTPPVTLKGAYVAGKLTGKIANTVMKKAKKAGVPEPVQFARISKAVEEIPRAPEPVQFAAVSGTPKVAIGVSSRAPLSMSQVNVRLADNHFEVPKMQSLDAPKTFSPAYSQIKAFSVKSALDGELYPKDKLKNLVNYLEKRNVNVYGTNTAPCFVVWPDHRPCQIYFPENPTVLQVKHELSHWLDYKNLGKDKYISLSRYERENLVLQRLQKNRLWKDLNKLERDFSGQYVDNLKPEPLILGVKK